jgi:hypothetical protein
VDLTGRVHDAERVKRTRGGNGSALANPARETEREGEVTGTDRLGPLDSEREKEGARERLAPTGGVRLSGAAGARGTGPSGLVWAEMAFLISLEFLMPFPFLFL